MESLFILYRLTYDQKYRNWGWGIFDAINKMYNSETKSYEGILDTTLRDLNFDGRAPGIYFLTETLKVTLTLSILFMGITLLEWILIILINSS